MSEKTPGQRLHELACDQGVSMLDCDWPELIEEFQQGWEQVATEFQAPLLERIAEQDGRLNESVKVLENASKRIDDLESEVYRLQRKHESKFDVGDDE